MRQLVKWTLADKIRNVALLSFGPNPQIYVGGVRILPDDWDFGVQLCQHMAM